MDALGNALNINGQDRTFVSCLSVNRGRSPRRVRTRSR